MGWLLSLSLLSFALATVALSLPLPCACERLNEDGKPGAVLSGGLRAVASNPSSMALLRDACLRKTQKSRSGAATHTASIEQAPEDYIRITTAAKEECKAGELVNQLRHIGGEHVSHHARVVSAIMPVASINQLKDLPCLHLAREEPVTLHQVNFQGARAMSVSRGLQQLSLLAAQRGRVDVHVGIVSDSFNYLGGYCDDIRSDALPGGINVLSDLITGQDIISGTDEGRAMAQVVYSVAPGATLSFATGLRGQADFANNILTLAHPCKDVNEGDGDEEDEEDEQQACHVIVDDVKYQGEPMFQNGIVAQAVNDARRRYNVTYFSSAGNQGFDSYSSEFVPSGVSGLAGELHAFGTAQNDTKPIVYQQYSFAPGFTTLVFQWDEPWFSVSGSEAACRSDIDIRASFDPAAAIQWLDGINDNVGGDAIEYLQVLNNDAAEHVVGNVSIEWVRGPQPGAVKYVQLGNAESRPLNFDTQSATCFGHANAGGSVPVGAYAYYDSRAYNNSNIRPSRRAFSSAVGTPILFSDNGTSLVDPKLHKNLLMAPDGTDTTFLGVQDSNGNKQPQFVGTSAAAPHAAGVAALLIGASEAPLSPAAVVKAMQATADDMDDPRTPWFGRKFDYATGFGAVNATRAAEYLSIVSCY